MNRVHLNKLYQYLKFILVIHNLVNNQLLIQKCAKYFADFVFAERFFGDVLNLN